MFSNYLKISLRSLVKRRFFSSLNILGLATGMAVCLLIFQYLTFELSFDHFNVLKKELYRINMSLTQNGVPFGDEAFTYHGLGPAAAKEIPEIAEYTRVHPSGGAATFVFEDSGGRRRALKADGLYYVDASFMTLFTYPLLRGHREKLLKEPNTMLLSESMVKKFFADADPVGQRVEVVAWTTGTYTITGVFKDAPENSHFQFDFLLPIDDLLQDSHSQYYGEGWSWTNFYTYVRLTSSANVQTVSNKLEAIVATNKAEDFQRRNMSTELGLQPLLDLHLYSGGHTKAIARTSHKTVYFFSVIAVFILTIAWVNYINLSTARTVERAKEVGVRKAAGARRRQLIWQFFFESLLINLIALFLALALAWVLLPYLNQLAKVNIPTSTWLDPLFWIGFFLIFVLGTTLSAFYPAYILSGFDPISVLNSQPKTLNSRHSLRRILVVFQFAASMALLTGTYVVYSQVEHMRRAELGIELEQVLIVRRPPLLAQDANFSEMKQTFENELQKYPAILRVAASSSIPGDGHTLGTSFRRAFPDANSERCRVNWIDYDFLDTYGVDLVVGRNFTPTFTADTSAVLLNATAARQLGFAEPSEAVGETVLLGGGNSRFEVIGVTEDFSWMSVAQPTPPLAFLLTQTGNNFSIRLQTSDLFATMAIIKKVYDDVFPGNPSDYFFLDAHFDQQYEADRRFGRLFGTFSLFAIFVACLGLVGLAAYTTAQRTKEIGVRKVLGASAVTIVNLLLSDSVKLVLVALLVTLPLVYLAAEQWLANFASRITLGLPLFLFPGVAVLGVALVAVSFHTVRIAMTDPVKSLRYE